MLKPVYAKHEKLNFKQLQTDSLRVLCNCCILSGSDVYQKKNTEWQRPGRRQKPDNIAKDLGPIQQHLGEETHQHSQKECQQLPLRTRVAGNVGQAASSFQVAQALGLRLDAIDPFLFPFSQIISLPTLANWPILSQFLSCT